MTNDRPDDGDGWPRYVVFTVLTAACTTLVTSLVTWGIDELKAKYGTKKETKSE